MKIHGLIRRRILVNFRVLPDVMQRLLPEPFRPKLLDGLAVAGICLIRLEQIRPVGLPAFLGLTSENAAHRVAVLWTKDDGSPTEGVYIPRRDTSSFANHLAGGRLFPGEHHRATFTVTDGPGGIDFRLRSQDGKVAVDLRAKAATSLPSTSRFSSMEDASRFFELGSLGYSATRRGDRLDGIHLDTNGWRVEPLAVEHVHSSFFADRSLFPEGSVEFDCALLMRDIEHSWRSAPAVHLAAPAQTIA